MNGSLKAAMQRTRHAQHAAMVDRRAATPTVTSAHRGPCPAVALAALAGWTYERAVAHLRPHGFVGRGLSRVTILAVVPAALGKRTRAVPLAGSVAATVRDRFANGESGLVFCHRHVMPVVRGRLLNADGFSGMLCTDAFVLEEGKVL